MMGINLFNVRTFVFELEMAGWLEDAMRVVFSKRKLFARPGSCDMRAGEQGSSSQPVILIVQTRES